MRIFIIVWSEFCLEEDQLGILGGLLLLLSVSAIGRCRIAVRASHREFTADSSLNVLVSLVLVGVIQNVPVSITNSEFVQRI
jgi:hypothetical protein